MRRFRYGRDGLCLVAGAAYLANRWLVPAAGKSAFLRDHFDDVLLIPAALPWLLWLQRRLGTRLHDEPPRAGEIALAFVLWSLAAEVLAPRLTARAVADPWDVVAYAGGALAAWAWWRRP